MSIAKNREMENRQQMVIGTGFSRSFAASFPASHFPWLINPSLIALSALNLQPARRVCRFPNLDYFSATCQDGTIFV
jgi:hypothetical protein